MCRFLGKKISSPINIRNLADTLRTTPSAARKAIQRLEDKGFLDRVHYKDGRGGWSQYRLPDNTYNELLHEETRAKVEPKLSQTRAKVGPQLEPQLEPKFSSSSIHVLEDLNTNTSNSDKKNQALPEEWLEISWNEDTQKTGFGINHLKQWFSRKYCTAREAQESIWHFEAQRKISSDEDRINTEPITYLMGTMAKSKYFNAPDGYVSPEDQAREKRLQHQRAILLRRQEQEEEHFKLVFEEFFDLLSGKQIRALSPQMTNPDASKAIIREKFREKYWLEIRDAFRTNSQLDIRQFSLEQEIVLQEEISNQSLTNGFLNHSTNLEAEAIAFKAKLEQLKKLDATEPSSQTKEAIQRYEQKLQEIESSIETEARNACDTQFGVNSRK